MSMPEDYDELEKAYGEFLKKLFKVQKNHCDNMEILESSIMRLQIDTIGNSMKSIRNVLDNYFKRKRIKDAETRDIRENEQRRTDTKN